MTNILEATSFGATSTTDDVLSGVNLKGKRILVTGVSAGLGVETARSLVAHGAQVVGAHAFQVGKVEFHQFEASAIRAGVVSQLFGRSLGLVQIPRRAYNLSTVRDQRASGFHAKAG